VFRLSYNPLSGKFELGAPCLFTVFAIGWHLWWIGAENSSIKFSTTRVQKRDGIIRFRLCLLHHRLKNRDTAQGFAKSVSPSLGCGQTDADARERAWPFRRSEQINVLKANAALLQDSFDFLKEENRIVGLPIMRGGRQTFAIAKNSRAAPLAGRVKGKN